MEIKFPSRNKIYFQWFWYRLPPLLCILGVVFFIFDLFEGLKSGIALYFMLAVCLACLLSEKVFQCRMRSDQKAFWYFLIYCLVGVIFMGLFDARTLAGSLILVLYPAATIFVMAIQTRFFLKRARVENLVVRRKVLLWAILGIIVQSMLLIVCVRKS